MKQANGTTAGERQPKHETAGTTGAGGAVTAAVPAEAENRDLDMPVGDAPPIARWRLALIAMAWLAWIGFLVAMVGSSRGSAGA
ncbi:MAG: hypothetical protein ACE5EX_12295 [Phycisphaerae bacterium]